MLSAAPTAEEQLAELKRGATEILRVVERFDIDAQPRQLAALADQAKLAAQILVAELLMAQRLLQATTWM